jgi:hypothetical protein
MTWKANQNIKKGTRFTPAEFSKQKNKSKNQHPSFLYCKPTWVKLRDICIGCFVLFTSNYIYFHKCSHKLWMGLSNWKRDRKGVGGWVRAVFRSMLGLNDWCVLSSVRSVKFKNILVFVFKKNFYSPNSRRCCYSWLDLGLPQPSFKANNRSASKAAMHSKLNSSIVWGQINPEACAFVVYSLCTSSDPAVLNKLPYHGIRWSPRYRVIHTPDTEVTNTSCIIFIGEWIYPLAYEDGTDTVFRNVGY